MFFLFYEALTIVALDILLKRSITAVSDNKRPAMSKTSLYFVFFCDANQNLKARRFLHLHLSGPLRKQKFLSAV